MVGMMGAGKTAVAEIFARDGEAFFRNKETQVIERLLKERCGVLSVGGGAFMAEGNRDLIRLHGISVWLRGSVDVLWSRVRRRTTRPLLKSHDPRGTLERLLSERDPIYALSDIVIDTRTDVSAVDTAALVHEAVSARTDAFA